MACPNLMFKLTILSAVVVAIIAAEPQSANATPPISECKGALIPTLEGGCSNVSSFGCCDAFGRVLWCQDNDLFCLDCAEQIPHCGWSPVGYYDCGRPKNESDPSGVHPISCDGCAAACSMDPSCRPECAGACGTCSEPGAVCTDTGVCYTPACGDMECGKDAQGYSCGYCGPTMQCVSGLQRCLPLPAPCVPSDGPSCDGCACESCVCAKYPTCCTDQWDLFCAAACELECGHNCSACPENPTCDTGMCGDVCGKDCGGCGATEVCYQNQCCKPDCDGKKCGPDGCGGQCGACGLKLECTDGECVACEPKCAGKECGPDGCGSQCGLCDEPLLCASGTCITGSCEGRCGADSVSCGKGCTCSCTAQCALTGDCCDGLCASCPEFAGCCRSDCAGRQCGDDGCGGSCGGCAAGTRCEGGECVACTPHCVGKECGDDKCNGSCGTCSSGFTCELGQCVVCRPQCDGKECGSDGCGGSCGDCGPDAICQLDQCFECIRDCSSKNCGPDGCGGTCGVCQDGKYCLNGQCVGNSDTCQGVSTVGCCQGTVTYWCAGGNLQQKNCALEAGVCGWNDEYQYYGCVSFSSSDPLGVFPYACPFCTPRCEGKQCGEDGCGGQCGQCEPTQQCSGGECVGVEPLTDVSGGGTGGNGPQADATGDGDGCSATSSRASTRIASGWFGLVFASALLLWWRKRGRSRLTTNLRLQAPLCRRV